MKRTMTRPAAVLAVLLSAWSIPAHVSAQAAGGLRNEPLVIRVYRVSDLVLPRPDHPYLGLQLPGKARGSLLGGGLGGFGGSGGGGGGFIGGGMGGATSGSGGMGGMTPAGATGGGMFAVPDDVLGQFGGGGASGTGGMGAPGMASSDFGGSSAVAIPTNELIQTITSVVAPETWSSMGGPAVITTLRGMLIVKQTQAAHAEIGKLLDTLRQEGGVLRGVTIRAWWIPLGAAQLTELLDSRPGAANRRLVRPDALAALAETSAGYRGEVTGFDNQTVHIISGAVMTLVQGATPVVGQGEIGYMPIVERLHTGALLEIRPTLVDEGSVVLDLASFVTEWQEPEAPTELPSGPIDRPQFVAHQVATTVRAPLGQPLVVGGLTVSQSDVGQDGAATPAVPLYLILEVTTTDANATIESSEE